MSVRRWGSSKESVPLPCQKLLRSLQSHVWGTPWWLHGAACLTSVIAVEIQGSHSALYKRCSSLSMNRNSSNEPHQGVQSQVMRYSIAQYLEANHNPHPPSLDRRVPLPPVPARPCTGKPHKPSVLRLRHRQWDQRDQKSEAGSVCGTFTWGLRPHLMLRSQVQAQHGTPLPGCLAQACTSACAMHRCEWMVCL